MTTSPRIQAVCLVGILLLAMATGGLAAAPVSYTTSFTDAAGAVHTVSFQGTADGPSLTGNLQIDGATRNVTATIGRDGSVSGRLSGPEGRHLGVFWGQRVGSQIRGSFDLNGEIGEWNAPASRLPLPR